MFFFKVLIKIYLFICMLWDPHKAFAMFVGIVKIRKQLKICLFIFFNVSTMVMILSSGYFFNPIFCQETK